jgi:hypothetical protein
MAEPERRVVTEVTQKLQEPQTPDIDKVRYMV